MSDRCLQKSAEAERARTLLAFAWWYHTGCGTAVARWLMRGGNWNPLPLPLLSSPLHSLTWVLPLTLSSPWRWRLCLVARVLIKIVSTQQADLQLRVYRIRELLRYVAVPFRKSGTQYFRSKWIGSSKSVVCKYKAERLSTQLKRCKLISFLTEQFHRGYQNM